MSYELPQEIAIALTTERIGFLDGLDSAELVKQQDVLRLLADLIEDRVKLRQQLHKLADSVDSSIGQLRSTSGKAHTLLALLDGQEILDD